MTEIPDAAVEAPFKPWEGDHTALVHELWDCEHDGLTLADDFDKVAQKIRSSRWMAAVENEVRAKAKRELLAELRERGEKANETLLAMRKREASQNAYLGKLGANPPDPEGSRLHGKTEGVSLMLSYIDEAAGVVETTGANK